MADKKRDADERRMEPVHFEVLPDEIEYKHRMGLASTDWSQGILPKHTDDELAGLKQSIAREGCRNPVITWRGQIVDGHKRAKICDELGIDYPTREIDFEDRDHAEAWVILDQLNQRNLDDVGRCEMAEKLELILAVAAKKRQQKGGREHGQGTKGKGTPPEAEGGTDAIPGPYGGLLDDVLNTKGESAVKAGIKVGVGKEKYRRYKEMKGYHTDPRLDETPADTAKQKEARKERIEEWDKLSDAKKEQRLKNWESIKARLRGPATKYTIGGEYKDYSSKRKSDERKDKNKQRVRDAKKQLPTGTHEYRFWGSSGPTWCKGAFQLKKHMDLVPDRGVKLLLCDPPYGQNYDPNDPNRKKVAGDVDEKTAAGLVSKMLRLFQPKLAPDAHVVFFVGVRQEHRMRRVLQNARYLKTRSHLVWIKDRQGAPGDTGEGFAPYHERALHATQGNPGFTGLRPHDAFEERPVRSPDHLTPKPVALLRQIIEVTTTKNELVADPFGGTASTLLAALSCGRKAWGAELEPVHYNSGYANLDDYIRHGKLNEPEALVLTPSRKAPADLGFASATAAPSEGTGFAFATSAPKTRPSVEEIVVPEPGAVAWGWAE